MMFYLEKIDPIIVKDVNDKTSNNIVHNKEGIIISQDNDQEKKEQQRPDKKKIKQDINKLNELLNEEEVNIYLSVEEKNHAIIIKVFEKNTDKLIRTFNEDEVIKLIESLNIFSGVLIDKKK